MDYKYRWIAQDTDGEIYRFFEKKPREGLTAWINGGKYALLETGKPNPNWRNSLIDLEKEDYEIVDGILERRRKNNPYALTDTDLLDAIVKHELLIDVTNGIVEVRDTRTFALSNKKGNIRKAIKKWLKKNVDKKETKE